MKVKINCKYKGEGVLCTNHKVDRSFFGFGKRKCVLRRNSNKKCKYKEKSRKPKIHPAPQTSNKKQCESYDFNNNIAEPEYEVVLGKNGYEVVRKIAVKQSVETLQEYVESMENKQEEQILRGEEFDKFMIGQIKKRGGRF